MRLRTVHSLAVALLVTTGGLQGCDNPAGPDVHEEGVIGFWEGEGGCWSIATATENFHPTELPAEYKEVGLRVRFQADRRPDIASFCPGVVVALRNIQAMP